MTNISNIRKKLCITQQKLSEQLGINRSTIAKWESGEAMPRADKLPDLARILKCNIDDLFKDKPA